MQYEKELTIGQSVSMEIMLTHYRLQRIDEKYKLFHGKDNIYLAEDRGDTYLIVGRGKKK